VIAVLLLGTAVTTSSPLYAAIYPTRGSNLLRNEDYAAQFGTALAEARVGWRTDPETVISFEPTRLVVTLVFGTELAGEPGPRVEIAWENEAQLTAGDPAAVSIEPREPIRKSLADARPREGGGSELEWEWEITAKRAGATRLTLFIKPQVYVDGLLVEGIAERNEPINIPVLVHPAEAAFDQAVESVKELAVDSPERMTDGRRATVVVSLPRTWDPDLDVDATFALDSESDSTGIAEAGAIVVDDDGRLSQSWTVKPEEPGLLTIDVAVQVRAQAGDRPPLVYDEVAQQVLIEVQPTLWDRLLAPVVYLTSIITLVGALLGVWAYVRKRRRPQEAGAESPDAEPDEDE
jgi:hypothetical protein